MLLFFATSLPSIGCRGSFPYIQAGNTPSIALRYATKSWAMCMTSVFFKRTTGGTMGLLSKRWFYGIGLAWHCGMRAGLLTVSGWGQTCHTC